VRVVQAWTHEGRKTSERSYKPRNGSPPRRKKRIKERGETCWGLLLLEGSRIEMIPASDAGEGVGVGPFWTHRGDQTVLLDPTVFDPGSELGRRLRKVGDEGSDGNEIEEEEREERRASVFDRLLVWRSIENRSD
jgi:hypothetical protein